MTKSVTFGRPVHRLVLLIAAAALACGIGGLAGEARADVSVGIGIGVPGPAYYGPGPYWYRPWGPYPPYYVGPTFDLFAAFPPTFVRTWPDQVASFQRQAYTAALTGPVGQPHGWSNGYDTGSAVAVREGHSGSNLCREVQQQVTIAGHTEQTSGAACRFPDGVWRLVQDNP